MASLDNIESPPLEYIKIVMDKIIILTEGPIKQQQQQQQQQQLLLLLLLLLQLQQLLLLLLLLLQQQQQQQVWKILLECIDLVI